jgi:hypothetical protein
LERNGIDDAEFAGGIEVDIGVIEAGAEDEMVGVIGEVPAKCFPLCPSLICEPLTHGEWRHFSPERLLDF